MDVIAYQDPGTVDDEKAFAARARTILRAHSGATNVIATWMSDWMTGKPLPPTTWYLVVADGRDMAVAMHAAGRNVVLSPLDDDVRQQALRRLAELLREAGTTVAGVSAREVDAQAFATLWTADGSRTARVVMHDVVYEIRHRPDRPEVEGSGRAAGLADTVLLTGWMIEFIREALQGVSANEPEAEAASRITRGGFHLWVRDGEVVSMAGLNGPADGVARIGPVYTPPALRGRGFAGALTAHITRAAMDRGAGMVMLFADKNNPASNRVYSRLGFEQVGTSVMLAFETGDDR